MEGASSGGRRVGRPAETVPDRVVVSPARLSGELSVPGDKSLSHRALIVGALAPAPVEVSGLATSWDVAATARALEAFDADVRLEATSQGGLGGSVAGPVGEPDDVIDCGNSGTSLRLLAGVAAGVEGLTVLTGDASLRRRPVDRVAVPLAAMGAQAEARAGRLPPLAIRGGGLRGVGVTSPVASAQVKSAVLLAGLRAAGPTAVTSPARSRDHTERLLRYFDVEVEVVIGPDGAEHVTLRPGPLRPRPIRVPGDPSSAAFWAVAAAPLRDGEEPGGAVTVRGICTNPTRLGFVAALRAMGARVEVGDGPTAGGEPVGDIHVDPAPLTGAVLAGATVVDAIDELPVLAVAGALSRDGLEVRDAAELRAKESDRIASLAELFAALGMAFDPRPDGFLVPGGQQPRGGRVDARGDHRIAMTACVAGTFAGGPVEVDGFACVPTSYPGFLDDLRALGGRVDVVAPGAAGDDPSIRATGGAPSVRGAAPGGSASGRQDEPSLGGAGRDASVRDAAGR